MGGFVMTDAERVRSEVLYEVAVPLTVGRATVSWNTLTGSIFDIYRLLSEMDIETAKATFFAVASDRSQRDMTSMLIDLRLSKRHTALARKTQELLGKANKLAGKRNDILHVVYMDTLAPEKVSQLYERGHLKNKAGEALIVAIHDFTMACLELASELLKAREQIQALPHYHGQELAGALRRYIDQRGSEAPANQPGYGLLTSPPTISGFHLAEAPESKDE
jgi:hypothetical protein